MTHRAGPADPGVDANRRLTVLTGVLEGVVLSLVVLSGLVFGWSPALHYFLGFAAIPPTLLKLGSTGWRFLGYYARPGSAYRAAGPPSPLPRLLGPVVVVSALAAFVTGVVLFFQGREHGTAATLHTDSAVVFSFAVLLHVAVHLRTTYEVSLADLRSGALVGLRSAGPRRALVAASAVAGLVVAVSLVAGYHWTLLRHVR